MSELRTPCMGRWREFFADTGTSSPVTAERLCEGCPILDGCLTDAIRMERLDPKYLRVGVWGGTTPKVRHQIAVRGTGHRRAHELAHIARGGDTDGCPQCAALVAVAA